MKGLFAALLSLLAMLGIVAPTSLGQVPKPSVYIEPYARFAVCLATSMAKKKVPVNLVTNRAQAAYILSALPITTSTSDRSVFMDGYIDPHLIRVANTWVVLSDSTSSAVVWSDFLSEPAAGRRTEQQLADLAAKHLNKFLGKNHGALPASAQPEKSHSMAALLKSLFSR